MIGAARLPRAAASLPALLLLASAARAADPHNCLFCHQYRGLSRVEPGADRVHLYFVQPEYVRAQLGPHARLACTDCHRLDEVGVVPHQATTAVDCTRTCHLASPQGIERRFSHADVAAMLADGAHSLEALATPPHAGYDALAPDQSRCLYCHDEPHFRGAAGAIPAIERLAGRVFDRCDACHAEQIPVDVAYALRHIAARLQPARPALELAQVCAVCHSDPHRLAQRGASDAVASYLRSFHGKAALLGDHSTASCVSCHVAPGSNVHRMLPAADPRSAVHPDHAVDACRSLACHPGADVALAAAAVHLDLPALRGSLEFAVAAFFVVLTLLTFGPSLVIVVLELFATLAGRHAHGDARTAALLRAVAAHPDGPRRLTRFTAHQRVQHWVLAILFALLALTGFPLKFAEQAWSRAVVEGFGGLAATRLVHHWAGLALVAGMGVHLAYVAWTITQRRRAARAAGAPLSILAALTSLPMWLTVQDGRKALHLLAYLLFLRGERPTFGRFSVKEKFEYIGVFWGTALLGLTGMMLWGEQLAAHLLGGRVLNVALIAHTYEAFLAIIHVGILHVANVVFAPNVFPLSPATLTGRTPAAEMIEGHGEMIADVARELGVEPAGGRRSD